MEEQIIKYLEGKLSHAESVELLRCADTDEELKKLFIRIQNSYALLDMVPEKKDEYFGRAGYERFRQILRRRNMRRIFLKTLARAAFVALLVAGAWYFSSRPVSRPVSLTEVYAPSGQRTKLTLADGSVVWLNARSTLSYPSDFSDDRRVNLTGEAFFEIASDPGKPFTVHVKDMNITALGTRFNVNSYPESGGIQTSLIEGSVKIWDDSGQELVLQPYQQANYINRKFVLEQMEHDDYFLWIKGVYSFVNEPLTSIIKKLERYYDVKIEVADLSILDYEFTGKFRQQDGVDMILRIIQHIHPFHFERKEDIIRIYN